MTTPHANPLSDLAVIAAGQAGVHEDGGENTGTQVRNYQSVTDEPGTGWPWCAAFVCWCVAQFTTLHRTLLSCEARKCLPREASVVGLVEWARKTGQLVVPVHRPLDGFAPQAGDIVCMEFKSGHHCGIVTGPMLGGSVPTLEGNTTGPYRSRVDEHNGGEVAAKIRPLGCITHFIRLSLKAQPVNPPNA